jgi:hypothetical protein
MRRSLGRYSSLADWDYGVLTLELTRRLLIFWCAVQVLLSRISMLGRSTCISRDLNLWSHWAKCTSFRLICLLYVTVTACSTILIAHYASTIVSPFSKILTNRRKGENMQQAQADCSPLVSCWNAYVHSAETRSWKATFIYSCDRSELKLCAWRGWAKIGSKLHRYVDTYVKKYDVFV